MRKESYFTLWKIWSDKKQNILSPVILCLISIAIVLSDWIYGYFTFSEYILFFISFIFILLFQYRLTQKQIRMISAFSGVLILHSFSQYFLNVNFNFIAGISGTIKLSFYLVTIMVLYNYIRRTNSEKNFLIINNIVAFFVIVLGLYFTYEISIGSRIPHEYFWRFTRWDIYSYYFEASTDIIRTRSLFSEPAHLGYYLNTLLAINLFNVEETPNLFVITYLVIGTIVTFSFSMIGIMIIILTIRCFMYVYEEKEIKVGKWLFYIAIPILMCLFIFWEVFNTTIIERVAAVLSGEDVSARMRLIESWQYINRDTLFLGNGIGNTPTITNVFAYILSDLGLGLFSVVLALLLTTVNKIPMLVLIIVLFNFSRGGYLSSSYWLTMLLLTVYLVSKKEQNKELKKRAFII